MKQTSEPNILALTPSKVRDYQSCPQQYKLKTVIRQTGNYASPSLSFGSSIHSALEEIHTRQSHPNHAVNCQQVLLRHWKAKDYGDERESERYFTRGLDALRRYMNVMGSPIGQIIGTEVYLSRTTRLEDVRVRLGCKVDRLELHPNGVLEVLDYKTNAGGQVPTPEFLANDLATFIYYALVRISYPKFPLVIVSQLNVLTLAKVEVKYETAKLTAHKQALAKLVHAIETGDFEPRQSGVCSWCPVRDYCPAFGSEADLDSLI